VTAAAALLPVAWSAMDIRPPGKSKGREIAERVAEAGLNAVPLVGGTLAVTLVTTLNWKLNQRRDKWLEELAIAVEELSKRVDGIDIDTLAENPLFVDAVVNATRTIEHTHQQEEDHRAPQRGAQLSAARST